MQQLACLLPCCPNYFQRKFENLMRKSVNRGSVRHMESRLSHYPITATPSGTGLRVHRGGQTQQKTIQCHHSRPQSIDSNLHFDNYQSNRISSRRVSEELMMLPMSSKCRFALSQKTVANRKPPPQPRFVSVTEQETNCCNDVSGKSGKSSDDSEERGHGDGKVPEDKMDSVSLLDKNQPTKTNRLELKELKNSDCTSPPPPPLPPLAEPDCLTVP